MEHERAVELFPSDKQDGNSDVDDGKSDEEEDPDELGPEQDTDALPHGILLAKAELQRGRPNIITMSGMEDSDNDHELYGEDRDNSDGKSEGGHDSEGEDLFVAVDECPKRKKLCQGHRAKAAKNIDDASEHEQIARGRGG